MANAKQIDFLAAGLFNSSGKPIAGGTVEFLQTGTTTPATVWKDANQVNTLANPATLSERGSLTAFSDNEIDLIIKDKNGLRITPDLLGFSYEISSTEDFGIDASQFGTAQDANAIQLAIQSAAGADAQVFMRPGEWLIDVLLTIPTNINLLWLYGAYAQIETNITLNYVGTWTPNLYQIHRGIGTAALLFDDRNNDVPSINELNGVHDNRTLYGVVNINGSVVLTGPLDVTGDTDLTGTLDVTGDTTLTGTTNTITGTTNILNGALDQNGNADITGTLDVTGDTTITGNTDLIGDLLIQKNADGVSTELLRFDRTSATPADNDSYEINYFSENDNDTQVQFGKEELVTLDVSDGTEKGQFKWSVADGVDGSVDEVATLDIDTFKSNNITTSGILKVDVDGTAKNAAGSLTLGAGNDAGIFFDGTDLKVETSGELKINSDTEILKGIPNLCLCTTNSGATNGCQLVFKNNSIEELARIVTVSNGNGYGDIFIQTARSSNPGNPVTNLRVNSNGIVTMPNQSFASIQQTGSVPLLNATYINYTAELFDNDNYFSIGIPDRITIPRNGIYLISTSTNLDNATQTGGYGVTIIRETSGGAFIEEFVDRIETALNDDRDQVTACIFRCNASEIIRVKNSGVNCTLIVSYLSITQLS